MQFATLREVLEAINSRVSVPPAIAMDEFVDTWKASEAAGLLRQTLHNASEDRPRWVERNKISRKPEFNDAAVHPEAMKMLEHAAGWYDREVNNRCNHVHLCLRAGIDPETVPRGRSVADWPFPGRQFFRPDEIGFDRAEILAFLAEKGILSPMDKQDKPTEVTPSPAPVANSASNAPAWTVTKPQRYNGYTAPLHRLLDAAHREGKPRPTARDALEEWRINCPAEIAKVLSDSMDYYDANGDTKTANLEAIRKAIARMTSAR